MIILLLLALSGATHPVIRPNSAVTPGLTRPLSLKTVCETRWGKDRRHVTQGMKKQVFAAYGIPWEKRALYEVDHLISRELGGKDAVGNLWPQPWDGEYGARKKDALENRLHLLTCRGEMTLEFAQEAIRSDWIAAYRLYVGDVPPRVARDNVVNTARRHSVRRSKRLAGFSGAISTPDVAHLRRSQLGASSAPADRWIPAALPVSIKRVVSVCSNRQVLWVDAARVVARMKDDPAWRDRSVGQHPDNAMRLDLAIQRPAPPKRSWDMSVSSRCDFAGPAPATGAFLNVLPDIFDRIDLFSNATATLATVGTDKGGAAPFFNDSADNTRRCCGHWIDIIP